MECSSRQDCFLARSHRLIIAILFLVVIVDLFTKLYLDTLTRFEHERSIEYTLISGYFLIPFAIIVWKLKSPSLTFLFSGALCNVLDSADGKVMNPFIYVNYPDAVGFNAADVFIYIGSIGFVCEIIYWLTKRLKEA